MDEKLTDTQALDALMAARAALGDAPGATVRANTALEAARRGLGMLQIALMTAADQAAERSEDQPPT